MELLLTRKENKILSILADERRLLQIHAENMEEDPRTAVVGDIYVVANFEAVPPTAPAIVGERHAAPGAPLPTRTGPR